MEDQDSYVNHDYNPLPNEDHLLVNAETGNKEPAAAPAASSSKALGITFCLMVVVALGNRVFNVLMMQPMYNYPMFVNLITSFIYIPASFAYVIPMLKYGKQISAEAQAIPKRKFAVMGALDSLAGIMQTFSVNFLDNGGLVTLLLQSAIPCSMLISRLLLKTKYKNYQYVGALVVAGGLISVMVPRFLSDNSGTGSNMPLWAAILILSCVPMCLSSVYKEKALGEVEIDAIYLNGWIAVFQFMTSLPLLLPSAPASDVAVKDIGSNLWNGARCLAGINSITTGSDPDDCAMAPIYTTVYMLFNLTYNVLIILILKYGSSNILWLAMTVMVPMSNIAFAMKFMPKHKPSKPTDWVGLVLILIGLVIYRFATPIINLWAKFRSKHFAKQTSTDNEELLVAPGSPAIGAPSTPALGVHNSRRHQQRGVAHSSRRPVDYDDE